MKILYVILKIEELVRKRFGWPWRHWLNDIFYKILKIINYKKNQFLHVKVIHYILYIPQ